MKTQKDVIQNQNVPYCLPIKEAAAYAHTSSYFIRSGIKTGKIKYMRSGKKIYVHIPALLEAIDSLCGVGE